MTAKEKIRHELSSAKLSAKAKAVAGAVEEALCLFCEQNAEFAQAVEQSDRTAAQCVESAVKGCGNSISDFDLYSRAVAFYFEGAKVHFNMTIDLGDNGFSNNQPDSLGQIRTDSDKLSGGISLSLDDLLL